MYKNLTYSEIKDIFQTFPLYSNAKNEMTQFKQNILLLLLL